MPRMTLARHGTTRRMDRMTQAMTQTSLRKRPIDDGPFRDRLHSPCFFAATKDLRRGPGTFGQRSHQVLEEHGHPSRSPQALVRYDPNGQLEERRDRSL